MVAAATTIVESSTSDTHPDGGAAPDIAGLAAAVQQALHQQQAEQQNTTTTTTFVVQQQPPPPPLPLGWVLKEARSQPDCYYYFNMDTGVSSWASPIVAPWRVNDDNTNHVVESFLDDDEANASPTETRTADDDDDKDDPPPQDDWTNTTDASNATKKRPRDNTLAQQNSALDAAAVEPSAPHSKQPRLLPHLDTTTTTNPKQVRVLHILRKHQDSRRPSSWRQPVITATRAQARHDLQGLQELLHEVQADPAELRATMEELARTESDCSSAKRGGDLGFFGPKKMQPAFEEAAFALTVGELSEIVETASGMHLILRIG